MKKTIILFLVLCVGCVTPSHRHSAKARSVPIYFGTTARGPGLYITYAGSDIKDNMIVVDDVSHGAGITLALINGYDEDVFLETPNEMIFSTIEKDYYDRPEQLPDIKAGGGSGRGGPMSGTPYIFLDSFPITKETRTFPVSITHWIKAGPYELPNEAIRKDVTLVFRLPFYKLGDKRKHMATGELLLRLMRKKK